MNIPTKFKEYNTIRKARRITFAEINERWLETEVCQRHYDALCLYEPEEE